MVSSMHPHKVIGDKKKAGYAVLEVSEITGGN
jgi:hypothetical protein